MKWKDSQNSHSYFPRGSKTALDISEPWAPSDLACPSTPAIRLPTPHHTRIWKLTPLRFLLSPLLLVNEGLLYYTMIMETMTHWVILIWVRIEKLKAPLVFSIGRKIWKILKNLKTNFLKLLHHQDLLVTVPSLILIIFIDSAETWYYPIPHAECSTIEESWTIWKRTISEYWVNHHWLEKQQLRANRARFGECGHQ